MNFDDNYDYKFIDEYKFNVKYLLLKNDGSSYKKFSILNHKVEEIKSSCIDFDSEFEELFYYKIDKTYFIKYKSDIYSKNNNNKEIEKFLSNLKKF